MKGKSQGQGAHPARWLLALTLGAVLGAVPALASAPSAQAAVTPVAVDDAYSTTQNAPTPSSLDALANDTMGAAVSWTVLTYPAQGTLGPADPPNQNVPGRFKYTPALGYSGTDSFQYCISLAIAGGPCISNIATVTISVLAAVPVDDHLDTPAATPIYIKKTDVLANDLNANATYLRWSVLVQAPANGALTSADGVNVTYAPSAGFVGTDTFKYCLSSIDNGPCESASATVFIDVGLRPTSRIFGADRFEVAVKIADMQFPTTASVVFVASGANYPDALSAGPAATKLGGPLLLTLPDRLPDVVAAKILKLSPATIIVVGGVNAVSDAVFYRLQSLVPSAALERIGGADRYEVSRAIANRAFGDVAHAYVATGANFPDALSAGAAAGAAREPVILVNGNSPSADAASLAFFAAHKTSGLTIVGGGSSVSAAVENSLRSVGKVIRVAGADRFETSSNLNHGAFAKADTVYLATGLNYPDALVGSALAGATGSPLYAVPKSCVPAAVLDDIKRLGATQVVLLGGTASLTDDVARLVPCAA